MASFSWWLGEAKNLGVWNTADVWNSGSGASMEWEVLVPCKESATGFCFRLSWLPMFLCPRTLPPPQTVLVRTSMFKPMWIPIPRGHYWWRLLPLCPGYVASKEHLVGHRVKQDAVLDRASPWSNKGLLLLLETESYRMVAFNLFFKVGIRIRITTCAGERKLITRSCIYEHEMAGNFNGQGGLAPCSFFAPFSITR